LGDEETPKLIHKFILSEQGIKAFQMSDIGQPPHAALVSGGPILQKDQAVAYLRITSSTYSP
jgi:hypothetical protein